MSDKGPLPGKLQRQKSEEIMKQQNTRKTIKPRTTTTITAKTPRKLTSTIKTTTKTPTIPLPPTPSPPPETTTKTTVTTTTRITTSVIPLGDKKVEVIQKDEINVKIVGGKMLKIIYDPQDTVRSLKHKIELMEGLTVYQQALFYAGKQLRGGQYLLRDCDIKQNAILQLVLHPQRARRRGKRSSTQKTMVKEKIQHPSYILESQIDSFHAEISKYFGAPKDILEIIISFLTTILRDVNKNINISDDLVLSVYEKTGSVRIGPWLPPNSMASVVIQYKSRRQGFTCIPHVGLKTKSGVWLFRFLVDFDKQPNFYGYLQTNSIYNEGDKGNEGDEGENCVYGTEEEWYWDCDDDDYGDGEVDQLELSWETMRMSLRDGSVYFYINESETHFVSKEVNCGDMKVGFAVYLHFHPSFCKDASIQVLDFEFPATVSWTASSITTTTTTTTTTVTNTTDNTATTTTTTTTTITTTTTTTTTTTRG